MQTQKMNPAQLEKIQELTLLSACKFAKLERQWEEYHSRPPDDPDFISRMEEDWTAALVDALAELEPDTTTTHTAKPQSLRNQLAPPARRRRPRSIDDLLLNCLQYLARLRKHNPADHPTTWNFIKLSLIPFGTRIPPPPPTPPSHTSLEWAEYIDTTLPTAHRKLIKQQSQARDADISRRVKEAVHERSTQGRTGRIQRLCALITNGGKSNKFQFRTRLGR